MAKVGEPADAAEERNGAVHGQAKFFLESELVGAFAFEMFDVMTDAHHATFKDLIEKTPWEKYGHGRDPRCQDCMVHAGYEPSAVLGANRKFGDSWKLLKWQLSNP